MIVICSDIDMASVREAEKIVGGSKLFEIAGPVARVGSIF